MHSQTQSHKMHIYVNHIKCIYTLMNELVLVRSKYKLSFVLLQSFHMRDFKFIFLIIIIVICFFTKSVFASCKHPGTVYHCHEKYTYS